MEGGVTVTNRTLHTCGLDGRPNVDFLHAGAPLFVAVVPGPSTTGVSPAPNASPRAVGESLRAPSLAEPVRAALLERGRAALAHVGRAPRARQGHHGLPPLDR
jgi:hypothetical protein